MDADHLDIYGDASALEASFLAFADLVADKNTLLHKKGLPLQAYLLVIAAPLFVLDVLPAVHLLLLFLEHGASLATTCHTVLLNHPSAQ